MATVSRRPELDSRKFTPTAVLFILRPAQDRVEAVISAAYKILDRASVTLSFKPTMWHVRLQPKRKTTSETLQELAAGFEAGLSAYRGAHGGS